jgi:hypothetical protein
VLSRDSPNAHRSVRAVRSRIIFGTLTVSLFQQSAVVLAVLLISAPAVAQEAAAPARVIDGSPAPIPPEVITRDAAQRPTIRALKLSSPLRLDGKLDEEIYQREQPFGGFIQVAPTSGAPASERSDVWVMFDADNIYVTCRCWDRSPPETWVVNELRRDTAQMRNNDHFGVMFDTFYDRRSGFMFYANPLGGLADYSVIDEGQSNTDWNPVWSVGTGRFDGGWTIEMAIPLKSIRFRSGPNQTWGIQMRRSIRHKNEWTYLSPVPAFLAGPQALNRVSSAGTLVGLDLPPASRNVDIKPYAISRLTTDRLRAPAQINDPTADFGADAKVAITANVTADLTYNTDFAQVEIDEQQVNLTRFNLFFPEKREFFLEGRGIFDFNQNATAGFPGANAATGTGTATPPSLFYTRRIGLNRSRVIPIDVGGRLTGKVGKYAVGALNIETGDEQVSATPATNFTVLRVKRDVLKRSAIGAIFTNRSRSTAVAGSNQAFGVDGSFAFFQNLTMGGYFAQTRTAGVTRDDRSYQARIDYAGDRYGAHVEYLGVGDNFNPEVGFVQRDNFRRSFGSARFSPRPARIESVRKFTWEGSFEHIVNGAGVLETRYGKGRFNVEFQSSDTFTAEAWNEYELLVRPFPVPAAPRVVIHSGGYTFNAGQLSYTFGAQRRASGTFSLQRGEYYNGTITAYGYSTARVSLTTQLSLEPSVSINDVKLPTGKFTSRILRTRSDYGFTPRMFASALLQYNSTDNSFSSNLRFRWEYRPGSELFAVYTEERDTLGLASAVTGLRNRAFVLKINRLLRF